MTRILAYALGSAAALAAACGGDGDDGGGSSCEQAGRAICVAACDCRDGDGCAVTDETGAGTISFDSEDDCAGLYVTLGCTGGGDATIDFDACEADVSAAECSGAGADGAVVSPPSCDAQ
jgi:hypothetical protein